MLGELWAIPIMLRLALIENLRRVGARVAAGCRERDLADDWAAMCRAMESAIMVSEHRRGRGATLVLLLLAAGTGEACTGSVVASTSGTGGAGAGSGTKSGEACAMSILGVVALGDASIDLAKSNGGVTQVASVDHKVFSILGIYANVCTVVHGS